MKIVQKRRTFFIIAEGSLIIFKYIIFNQLHGNELLAPSVTTCTIAHFFGIVFLVQL